MFKHGKILLHRSSSNITLIGFSKGCVVLNQLLHELDALRCQNINNDLYKFASRIQTFFWLDGGHNNGGKVMIWPTDINLISTLDEFHIRTEIVVTPFQINPKSPYKIHHSTHYRQFNELLSNFPALSKNNREMFFDQEPSIEKHFDVLFSF